MDVIFYELDHTGKLVASEGGRRAHHRVAQPSCLTPRVSEANVVLPKNGAPAPAKDSFGDGFEFDFGTIGQIEDSDAFWDTANFFSGAFE